MIAVVDYDTGNLRSVAEALRRAGAEFRLTACLLYTSRCV